MTHRGPFQPLPFCDSVILSVLLRVGAGPTCLSCCDCHENSPLVACKALCHIPSLWLPRGPWCCRHRCWTTQPAPLTPAAQLGGHRHRLLAQACAPGCFTHCSRWADFPMLKRHKGQTCECAWRRCPCSHLGGFLVQQGL